MRLLIQRVSQANVAVDNNIIGEIKRGFLVLVGIEEADTVEDAEWLAQKLVKMRLFDDQDGVMNLDLLTTNGELLIVSQFTLHASTKKGNRPSWIKAAPEAISKPLYENFVRSVETALGRKVATGCFGADMKIELTNDGPVTIWIDSKAKE
jgi:D-tyrosyl-tRNA(Tyr) deacylase